MGATAASTLVESRFGPGHAMYVKTRAGVPADAVWSALKDFTPARPTLWPFIEPSLYEVYDVGERSAEVREGSRMPGKKIWARERYDWDDDAMEMQSTIVESNFMKPGGTARMKVTRDGEGCFLEEWYERERIGLLGKVFNTIGPRILPAMIAKGRGRTYAMLAERKPLQ